MPHCSFSFVKWGAFSAPSLCHWFALSLPLALLLRRPLTFLLLVKHSHEKRTRKISQKHSKEAENRESVSLRSCVYAHGLTWALLHVCSRARPQMRAFFYAFICTFLLRALSGVRLLMRTLLRWLSFVCCHTTPQHTLFGLDFGRTQFLPLLLMEEQQPNQAHEALFAKMHVDLKSRRNFFPLLPRLFELRSLSQVSVNLGVFAHMDKGVLDWSQEWPKTWTLSFKWAFGIFVLAHKELQEVTFQTPSQHDDH